MLYAALRSGKATRRILSLVPKASTADGIAGISTISGCRYLTTSRTPVRPNLALSDEDRKLVPRGSALLSTAGAFESDTDHGLTSPPKTAEPESIAGSNNLQNRPDSAPTAAGRYAPWEIRALLVPLLPVGDSFTHISNVVHLLPSAARKEMEREGTPLQYVEKYLSDSVVVKGGRLSRRTASGSTSTEEQENIKRSVAPPPPPVSVGPLGSHPSKLQGASPRSGGGGKTTLEVLDMLIEFIPTFFVQHHMVADQLPSEITRQYADSSFLFYLKRFRHYIDIRASHGSTEIRLHPDFSHPKRGAADARYTTGLSSSDMLSQLARGRRPPRHSEANLIQFIVPRMPVEYTPIATVLQDVSDIVSRHPSFDPRLGVTGLFEKYPEYFQITDSKLRVRPFRSAPNSLDDLNAATSPLPAIYEKVKRVVDAQAEGKDYGKETERAAAVVPTGKLYALLTNAEKTEVKAKCRSFPRFLRMHGAEIVVSVDSMKVYQFRPTHESCAETLMDQRLMMGSLSPHDPILKVPAAMDESVSADWAVRELYDALPLMQCAELSEVMSLVPPSVRNALPQEVERLVEHLALFPDYFSTWPYPDDPTVMVVQRAKLEPPHLEKEEIIRMVLSLVPQGGIETCRLMRRVPLPLQRHLYRHGLKKVLGELKEYFLIVGDKVMRMG